MDKKYKIFKYTTNENKNIIIDKNINKNIDWYVTFLKIANTLGERSHCISKKIGCLITKKNRIISTGINGTPQGLFNCDNVFYNGFDIKNELNREIHHNFSKKYEIHSEINAIIHSAKNGISIKNGSLFVNCCPCNECSKAILGSGIKNIIFENFYDKDMNGFIFLVLSNMVNVYQVFDDSEENVNKIIKTIDKMNYIIKKDILNNYNPF